MARTRTARTAEDAAPAPRRARDAGADAGQLTQTARRMVGQIEQLVTEIASLRRDNESLRAELRGAVAMLEKASSALGGAVSGRARRGRRAAGAGDADAAPRARRSGRATGRAARGRATPADVTPDVVRAVIGRLGPSTAADIAAEISKHTPTPVTGRAIRFLAERAGAIVESVDGQRRYRLN